MNHYPHHIGDYIKDTAHLDPLEDGIYRRMLDLYYTQEGPLDADMTLLCRRLRVDARKHGKTVEMLLREFFKLDGQAWRHSRCDKEISDYRTKAADRDQKAAHEAERMRRHRERRKELFDALRERGQVPKWDTSLDELQRLLNANSNGPATDLQREQVPNSNAPATANQNQNQNQNQNHRSKERERRKQRASPCPPEFEVTEVMSTWAVEQGVPADRVIPETEKFLDYWRSTGKPKCDWDATWRNWMRKSMEFRR